MNNVLVAIFASGALACSVHGEGGSSQRASLPGSMEEFVNWHLDHGACGSWSDVGVTKDMWVGIPAGIKVTNTHKTWYDVPTQQLINSHHMVTEDGRVISTGSNVMTWNSEDKAVVSAGSGFDMGKPYNGTSILVGMTKDSLSWEYTEQSQGKTTVYETVETYTGRNTRTNSVKVKGADSKAWVSEATRSNPAMEMLDGANLAGTWEQTGPDGTIWREVVSWVADEHVLKYEGKSKSPGGAWKGDSIFIWYWDPAYDHISTLYLDDHGTVIHGKVDSITRNGDSVSIITTHEGSRFAGLTMSTQMTQLVTKGTITTTFQDVAIDGIRHKLGWSEGVQTTKRVD